MDLLTLIFLDVLFFFGSHLVTLVFYWIGMISEKPKSVMRWYIAGTILDLFAAFGLLSLIHRSQSGIPTKENLLSLTGSLVICAAFYFIMRRKANRLRNSDTAIPISRYQMQKSEMGEFVVDSEAEEVIREESPKPKRRFTALSVVLLVACVLLAASTCFFYSQAGNNARRVEALEAENAELQDTLRTLREVYRSTQKRINKLAEEKAALSDQLATLGDNIGEMIEPYYFLQSNIGFIIEGSNRYHNYNCSIFQNSDTYWAHNIEYCEYLGYSKCPECWD